MNGTLTLQLFTFLAVGAMFIAATLQLGGDYDFITEVRHILGTQG